MLKKLNGKITKLLFYIKNNFLSCTFKLSVIGTMLILLYLVCILNQPNAARSSRNSEVVRPIENSQKLMMTVSTEIPSNLDSYFTTEEVLTTIDNVIPKKSGYFETHPLFPIQEQTTALMDSDRTTKSAPETTVVTTLIHNPEYTTTVENEFTTDETKMWQSTTESLTEEATTSLKHFEKNEEEEEEPPTSPMPTSTTLSTTTSLTNPTTERTYSTSIPTTDIADDLFMDNWSIPDDQPLKIEDSQIHLPEESSFQLKETSPESLFLNDDNEFSVTVGPAHVHESETTLKSNEELRTSSTEEVRQSHEFFTNPKMNKDKMTALAPSMFAPGNFFNLFNTDHISAMSNRKPVWWPKPRNTPDLPSTTVKGRKRHINGIHPIYESEEAYETPRIFNRVFSRKLKDSVNFLERFFGNFVME